MAEIPCPLPVENLEVRPLFHPIVNVRSGSIIGLEALARFPAYPGVSPEAFFVQARAEDQALALDRRCREAAVSAFCGGAHGDDMLLFLNLDSVVFRPETVGSGVLASLCERHGLPPERVVIEILENRAEDIDSLQNFIRYYRGLGFLIAVDDIGSGYSNLNRITVIKPDIVKIDRSLVSGIDGSHHRKAVAGALTGLARRIGALTVGEGVETLEEAAVLLELGVDFLQGYHYSKPLPVEKAAGPELTASIAERMEALRAQGRDAVSAHHWYLVRIEEAARSLARSLENAPAGEEASLLRELIAANAAVAAVYTLDQDGIQISETISRGGVRRRGGLFMPAEKGADQSFKPYYLNLRFGAGLHISEPYISLADGRVCRTCSLRYGKKGGVSGVLCVDFHDEEG